MGIALSAGNPAENRSLLTAADVAARTRTSPKSVYQWASEGRIPHIRLGRVLRFDPAEVDAWLASHRVALGGEQ